MTQCTCIKCRYEITTANIARHFESCDGRGTRHAKLLDARQKNPDIVCSECGKKFSTRQALGSHMWRHSDEGKQFRENTKHIKKGMMNGWQNKTPEEIRRICMTPLKTYKVFCPQINDTVLVQSTWEVKYAEYLNARNIAWVNSYVIEYVDDLGLKHKYFPDFYLPVEDTYIEVKGYFREYDIRKMRNVISQHPSKKIIILKRDDLKALGIAIK